MPQDSLSQKTHSELEDVASKHHTFASFMHEVQLLADTVWHNSRAKGHDPSKIPETSPESPAAGANAEGDGGQPVITPADPASPKSDGGFPTTNVGVVVNEQPETGTSVPVQH